MTAWDNKATRDRMAEAKKAAYWSVVPNDVVGGWSIAIIDLPLSEHPGPLGLTVVADAIEESTARHIVDLHNEWLESL